MEVATTCVRCGNVAIKIAIAPKSKSDAFYCRRTSARCNVVNALEVGNEMIKFY